MKRYQIFIFTVIFVFGLFAPAAHLSAHDHEDHAATGVEFSEFCGGEKDPCSQPEHDHSESDRHSHDANCRICHPNQVFNGEVQTNTVSFKRNSSSSLVKVRETISLKETHLTTSGSRAPPANS